MDELLQTDKDRVHFLTGTFHAKTGKVGRPKQIDFAYFCVNLGGVCLDKILAFYKIKNIKILQNIRKGIV